MKKSHISIITIISIIFLLVLLFFTAPVESQDVGIESLGKTSKAFASVTSSTISTVVFIYVNEVKNTNNFLRTLQNSIKDKTLVLLRKNEKRQYYIVLSWS